MTAGKKITAPGYRLDVQTSPRAQIRSMEVADGTGGWRQVLDDDFRGTSPYLGVGQFGATDVTGPAQQVEVDGSSLRLEGVPFGNEAATADWTFELGTNALTTSVTADLAEPPAAPVWEASMTFDGTGERTGDDADPDRPGGDVAGFPAWTQSSGGGATVAARFAPGSSWGTDNRFYAGQGAVVWQPHWQPGGRALAPGTYDLGTWRLGASPFGGDDELGARLR